LHRRQVLELYQFENRRTLSLTVARGVDEDIIHTTSGHPFALIGQDDARALSMAEARNVAALIDQHKAGRTAAPDLGAASAGIDEMEPLSLPHGTHSHDG